MSLASAFSTALTGLSAAETQIDVVGNNLANSQTVGFKESSVAFATQLFQTLSPGGGPTTNNGGTNPRQIGLGVKVSEITPQMVQGSVQASALPSDLALNGDGFFIVEASSGESLYTRNGMFRTNAQNELVTINGERVLGYTVDDQFQLQTGQLSSLTIPLGSVQVAEPTQNVYLQGFLTPSGDLADAAQVIESQSLSDGALPQPNTGSSTASAAPTPDEVPVNLVSSDGGGTHPEGVTYRYRFAFVDNAGTESTVSNERSISVPAGNGAPDNVITLQNLPTAVGEYDTLRIYRTAADGNDYYRLDEVDISGGGAVQYVDDGSQALDLGTPLDQGVLNGNYSYLITYARTGEPESFPSPVVGPINVVDGRVHLQNIPAPPTPGPGDTFPAYDRVRIYRNLSTDSSTYYLVDEIQPGLDYTDSKSDTEISQNSVLDLDGPSISTNTLLTNVYRRDDMSYTPVFQEGTLQYTPRKGGRVLDAQTFDITSTSTVQDLLDFMREASGILRAADDPANPVPDSVNNIPGESGTLAPGLTITSDGRIRLVSNNGSDNAVDIDTSAFSLTDSSGNVTTPLVGFSSVQEASGQSTSADFVAYDSLGMPVDVRVTAVMESRDDQGVTYRWFADSPDNSALTGNNIAVGTGLVTFDSDGNLLSATNTQVDVDRRGIPSASPLSFNLDFGEVSGLATDEPSLAATSQDGFPPGTLASYTIGEDGVINGSFTNGAIRTLGQIRLARFANATGLIQRGDNLFAVGPNSGLPIEGNPGENGIAEIVAGAVELSNTNIGQNLIDLVLATAQYRGNTRVISTAQQMLDEILNLRR